MREIKKRVGIRYRDRGRHTEKDKMKKDKGRERE